MTVIVGRAGDLPQPEAVSGLVRIGTPHGGITARGEARGIGLGLQVDHGRPASGEASLGFGRTGARDRALDRSGVLQVGRAGAAVGHEEPVEDLVAWVDRVDVGDGVARHLGLAGEVD